jgi:hypothetical protein
VTRYLIDDALKNPPTCRSPEQISDVIILTGLNNSTKMNESVTDIVQKELNMITAYSKIFPRARFHIGPVAPVTQKQVLLNRHLEILAKKNQIPFISNHGMFIAPQEI